MVKKETLMNQTKYLINSSGNQTVQICLNENSQIDLVTSYIKDGLLNGEAVILIAKPELRQILKSKMGAFSFNGKNIQELQVQGQIKFFDAESVLSTLRVDGILEEDLFYEGVAMPIYNAKSIYGKVRVFGEMVDILWKERQHDMAIQLESFWKNLFNTQELTFLCTYTLNKLSPNSFDEELERICKYHSHLVPVVDCDLSEQSMDEAIPDIFRAAWNRVVNKLASTSQTKFSPNLLFPGKETSSG